MKIYSLKINSNSKILRAINSLLLNMTSVKYRPEIDGLRAFAVLPVILFHMGNEWIPGGFIGVDVFFVISGFLITKIILKESEQNTFSLTQFWLRRVRRIIPALITMILVTSVVGLWVLYKPDLYNLGRQGIASAFSVANIYFWRTAGDYWGFTAENSPLLHTWTLSVEEQFYLFFPLMLVLVLKFYKHKLVPLFGSLVLASLLLFVYGTHNHPSATFYLLPTRAWELGIGCVLAMMDFHNRSQIYNLLKVRAGGILSVLGFLAIIFSYILIDGSDGVSAFLVMPVIGAAFVIAFTNGQKGIINILLTKSPIVYIGKISYSLYLWHWPVFFFARNIFRDGKPILSTALSLPILFAVSIVSFHLVEQSTRYKKNVVGFIAIYFIAVASFSFLLTQSNLSQDISIYSETVWRGSFFDVRPNQVRSDFAKRRMMGISEPVRDSFDSNSYAKGGTLKIRRTEFPEVVLLGDSHALMWAGVLDEITDELGVSASFYAADGTPVFFELPIVETNGTLFFDAQEKLTFDEQRLHYLKLWKPKVVVIAARWEGTGSIELTKDLIKFLSDNGSNILLIEQPPVLYFGDKNTPQYLSFLGFKPIEGVHKYIKSEQSIKYESGRALVRDISATCKKCELVTTADIFLNRDEAWVLDSSDVLYIDDDHLSEKGASKVKQRIAFALKKYLSVAVD